MILQNPEFLLLAPLLIYLILRILKTDRYGRKVVTARTVTVALLLLAAASPAITQTQQASTDQKLNILVDNTTSMKAIQEADIPIEGEETVFIRGNNSRIFSQAAQNIDESSENLLITDGQTDQETDPLIEEAQEKNASVSVYDLEERDEAAVEITGPSTTVPEAENQYTLELDATTDQPVNARITLDGEEVYSGQLNESYSFTETFDSEGQHRVEAEITSQDIFQQNNKYYKTVKVREKPEILTVGQSGSLERNLEDFYNIDNRQNVPENLDDYYSVILKKPVENERLKAYIAEGNGLMYTGSLEEQVPSYLPVRKVSDDEEEAGAKIVIVIDASFGTGQCVSEAGENNNICTDVSAEGGSAKESIRIAYSLVDTLSANNRVGAVAYNRESYLISEPSSLANNRESLKNKISRISPDGPSFHDEGLEGGSNFVSENDTVVFISDGKIGDYERNENVPQKLRRIASDMDGKLVTVGVGEGTNSPLLEDIAERTGGYYLENDEAGRLSFRFGSGGGETEYKSISVVDPSHFITEGLELDGSATGFAQVDTKRSGSTLVSGSNGKEFLSSWRYGLGRVAAFSAGGEDLSRTTATDPALVSKTASWTVGNPQRKRDNWTEVKDTSRPEKPEARASYQVQGLTQKSEDLYTGELSTESLGFHNWSNQLYAYNYNKELDSVGQDMDKLNSIPRETGGRIYDSSNINSLPERVESIDRTVERQITLSPYIAALALLLFLGEVGYRKRNGRL